MDYVDTIRDMFEFEWNPVLNWVPVIEPNFGQERFLTDDPYRVMESGNIHKVPLIIGITEYEFYYLAFCKCSLNATELKIYPVYDHHM